jgi:hypothetical protein
MTSGARRGARRGSASRFNVANATALHAICKLDAPRRRALLRAADDTLVRSICECALNTLRGNVRLSPAQKKRLGKHRKTLRSLASSNGTWQRKKRLLVQRGGFLPLLLAPIIGGLVARLFPGGQG